MNIAIVGASDVGVYLATLLSKTDHNVILVDQNPETLASAAQNLDIAIKHGSGTNAGVLQELCDNKIDILIAVTASDAHNLFICFLAKNLGYKQTIARCRDVCYTQKEPIHYQNLFGVDHLIFPEKLVADNLLKNVLNPAALSVASFAYGNVEMATYQIPNHWNKKSELLRDLAIPKKVMVGLIYRKENPQATQGKMIFPHGNDVIRAGDEVTFVGERKSMRQLPRFLAVEQKVIQSAMILGGSRIGIYTAHLLLAEGIRIKIVDSDYATCLKLAELLPKAMVIHHEGTDPQIFDRGSSELPDLYIACTKDDETNIIAAMLAQETGIKQVMAVLSKNHYQKMLQKLQIKQASSAACAAADAILSMIQTKTLAAVAALYDDQAEIIEMTVSKCSSFIQMPLSALGPRLPAQLLIAAIQHCGQITIAKGDSVIRAGDTVIFIMNPKYWEEIQRQL